MSSQSLYRKWRSSSFADIYGQPHIVRTLQNAIRGQRVAHAYLFTGPRGTGKTSTARVLAKAVNCLDPQDGAPCLQCALCQSIGEGRSTDIVEIDGASNNGIEDVRVLRERVAFAPTEATFKVYIIDEVHRLSVQAFDGLLKTLEEPPKHVIFIFASTEPHKVPPTILSRCQRFDFRRIDRDDTVSRLQLVAEEEGISLDDEGMLLIAQQSGGSLRDALGILDQVRAFAGNSITADQIREGIGIGRPATIAELTGHIVAGDLGSALKLLHDAVSHGVDPHSLNRQLIEYWRALLLQVSGAASEINIDPALEESALVHARDLTPEDVVAVLRALTEQVIEPRLNVSPELPLEIALVQSVQALHQPQTSGPPEPEVGNVDEQPATSPDPPSRQTKETPAGTVDESEPVSEARSSDLSSAEATPLVEADVGSAGNSDGELPGSLPEAWPQVVEAARARSRRLQGLLRDARLVEWSETEITLGFRYGFHRDETDRPENRAALESIIGDVTGAKLRVRCLLAVADPAAPSSPNGDDTDSFVEEAERMLRGVHARQMKTSRTVT